MINADIVFAFFTVIFGFIGAMRGWVREIIATSSLILAIFVLNQFGSTLASFATDASPAGATTRFAVKAVPFLVIAFFGYLGPAVVRNRFENSARGRIEQGIISFICGAINGFLIFSTLAYLAWQNGILGDTPFPPERPLFTPPPGGWSEFFWIKNSALLVFSGNTLIIVLVAIFLFLIVVLI
ncbi:MAG: CvpA family protein [Anaerolineae bacterium]|nr:CvpA family protein [Thermoflexales bacterium]MDW8406692.1 CvpA family protein [Anaerolineae bacterium]